MTAIAYRNGVMAADTAVWMDNTIVGGRKKIFRAGGCLASAVGASMVIMRFREWLEIRQAGETFIAGDCKDAGFEGIAVRQDGTVELFDGIGGPCSHEAPFFALGCASQGMMYAMAAGATAEQAVKIAILYDAYAAGGIQIERLLPDDAIDGILAATVPAPMAFS